MTGSTAGRGMSGGRWKQIKVSSIGVWGGLVYIEGMELLSLDNGVTEQLTQSSSSSSLPVHKSRVEERQVRAERDQHQTGRIWLLVSRPLWQRASRPVWYGGPHHHHHHHMHRIKCENEMSLSVFVGLRGAEAAPPANDAFQDHHWGAGHAQHQ